MTTRPYFDIPEWTVLQRAVDAVAALLCPAGCYDGSFPKQIAEGEWIEVQCEWCAKVAQVRQAAGCRGDTEDVPLLLSSGRVEPCHECGRYSYHEFNCPKAARMDPLHRNYISKSWEPHAITQPCAHESSETCCCGTGPEIHELVAQDMVRRHETGMVEYGVSLRDCEIDTLKYAYEESLDLSLYLRRAILERDRVMGPDVSVRR